MKVSICSICTNITIDNKVMPVRQFRATYATGKESYVYGVCNRPDCIKKYLGHFGLSNDEIGILEGLVIHDDL